MILNTLFILKTNDSLVDELKKIDLRRFFWETRKNYALVLCRFGQIDCRKDWKLIGTLAGVCLRFIFNLIQVVF